MQPSKLRTCIRQRNQPNTEAGTTEEVNIAALFLITLLLSLTLHSLLLLRHQVSCNTVNHVFLERLKYLNLYRDDLPSPELFNQEFSRRRDIYQHKPVDQRSKTCSSALKECDTNLYSNLSVLLTIVWTHPVTLCECEHNASVVRRLATQLHSCWDDRKLTDILNEYPLPASCWPRHYCANVCWTVS